MKNNSPAFSLLFCFLLALPATSIFSQQYYLRNYSIEEGLAGISVTSIMQDSRGYIWISTQDGGVSKFDGKEFTSYRKKNGLGDNWINCQYEDAGGNLWFGTETNGITKFDGTEFTQYSEGLTKVDKIFSDSAGKVLIYNYPKLYELKNDSIILQTQGDDLTLQNFFRAGGPKAYKTIIDARGNKWIATFSGVYLIRKEFVDAEDAYEHRELFPLSSDQPDEPATSLLQDREGNIWIGTAYHGVFVFVDGAFSNFNGIHTMHNEYITSINKAGDSYVVGTAGGIKLLTPDPETGDMQYAVPEIKNFASASQITAMYKNPKGELFIADENSNVVKYNGTFSQFSIDAIPEFTTITAITETGDGTLWFATASQGIFVWNNTLLHQYTDNDNLTSNNITCLFTDSKNNIWIATRDQGIMKYDGKQFTPYSYFENGLINDNISVITEGPEGLLWFGSPEGGICSYDGNTFSHYSENDVLSSNAVNSLSFDTNGNLWVGLSNGLDKLSFGADGNVIKKHYDEYDGFTGIKNNNGAIYSDGNGTMWFGTVDGLFRYNPKEDFDLGAKPLVELKDIRLFYEKTDFSEYADTLMVWNRFPVNLKLPYNKNHLSFDFAALIFAIPEKITYEVMLENFDNGWQSQGSIATITYSNLPPGDYTFMVKASNAEGVWSEPVSFSFTILKPFWATWAFRIPAAIMALALIWFIYTWRNRRLEKRAEQLELVVEERTSELHQQKMMAEEAADRAERSEKAKEEFLANMSHEIRTPMNAIMGMTRLLLEKEPRETQLKYLNAIRQSSDNLLVIINDILDLSKIEAGKMELEEVPFLIRNLLNNLGEIMKFKSDDKGIDFLLHVDEQVPECIIGDPVRLNQILINLTGNAIKFTEKGSVKIICKEIRRANTISTISFCVKDTGVGIDKEKISSIFESFSQADKATTRKFGGTGLGLSISKRLTDLFGGKIYATSQPGTGSEFFVEIPFAIGAPADAIDHKSAVIIDEEAASKDFSILLVEDNAFNQMVAIDSIEAYFSKVRIDVAENGKIALEKLASKDYDVILMDVQMPVMDGYETAREIRKLENTEKRTTPIVAMTASVIKSEVDKCYESGMTDFIAKPFEPGDLMQKITRYVHTN